ncbi:MAG: gephyrin-like molybdotransferase Glp [Pseudomonadota bacterium]
MSLLSVSEALDRLFSLMPLLPSEQVPLADAVGRVLREDAVANRDQPPFAASAMDGYAVRSYEATVGARLHVVGQAAAGARYAEALSAGGAVRIFTGAPVPDGADSILIQEDAERIGDVIEVRAAPRSGAYIRPAGGDFRAGTRLTAVRRLSPRDLGLAAAMNVPVLTVARRPLVAIIPTGDELIVPGETPGPDQIVASSGVSLAAKLEQIGAQTRLSAIARDSTESLRAAFEAAADADVIVTLGGASVGEHDLVAGVLSELGAEQAFYKIAMRPGKPLMAGRLGEAVVVGLPGNPVSAMICAEIFLIPALEASLGLPAKPRSRRTAELTHDLAAGGAREHYLRAILERRGAEADRVRVFENQDSSLVATLATANALVVTAPGAPPRKAGTEVEVIALD